ncbi:MAG: hypothetical protein AB1564_07485 [Chloroflexota bacterium]
MSPQSDYPLVFQRLKAILQPFASRLTVKTDSTEAYYLDGPFSPKYKKELFFGSAQVRKNYVSYYLMPVYMYPELLKGVSPELKRHMQGKSCFNFKKVEPALFEELAALTRKGFESFMQREFDRMTA